MAGFRHDTAMLNGPLLVKWTQPSSRTSLTRGTIGVDERATHTHCQNKERNSYAQHYSVNRVGEDYIPVARNGCAR
jgi:hypothetical protein